MKDADIVRVAMLNTLQYVDPKTADLPKLFGSEDVKKLTQSGQKDIKNQKVLFGKLFNALREFPTKDIE